MYYRAGSFDPFLPPQFWSRAQASFALEFADLGAGIVDTGAKGGYTPTFTRATSSWTILSDGTYGLVASGSPRSYYSPTGTYLGYLAEGARTNLCQRGEDFANVWTDVGTPTLSADTTTLGTLNLSTVGDDSAAALEGKIQTISFTGDAVKAISVHVKQGTSTSSVIRVRDTSAGADRLLAAITWSGTVPVVTMTTGTDLTGTPQQQGTSGVYRLSFATSAVTAANTNSLQIYPATDAALAVTGTGTILVGGVQAEDATFASSLIRTPASATVTRNADVLTYATTGWLSQTAGTLFAQALFLAGSTGTQTLASINDTTANERMHLRRNNGSAQWQIIDGGVQQAIPLNISLADSINANFAGAYAVNSFQGALNGVQGTEDTSGTLPTTTTLEVGCEFSGVQAYGPIRRVSYWSSRLPNSVLAQLTT